MTSRAAQPDPRCPKCGGPGGVMLFTSVAPCNRCFIGAPPQYDPPRHPPTPTPAQAPVWDGVSWPPPIGARVVRTNRTTARTHAGTVVAYEPQGTRGHVPTTVHWDGDKHPTVKWGPRDNLKPGP